MTDIIASSPVGTQPVKVETFDAGVSQSASEIISAQHEIPAEPDSSQPVVPAEEAPKPKQKEDASAARFAELQRRTKEQYKKGQELKQLEEQLSPIQSAMAKSKENPLALLEAAGLSYEDLTDFILNNALNQPENATQKSEIEQKVEALEAKLKAEEDAKVSAAEKEHEEYVQKSIESFNSTVIELADSSEDFELIKVTESHSMVYDLVLAHHAQTGEVLPVVKAMEAIEAYLLQELEEKALKTNKIKQKFAATQANSSQATVSAQKPAAQKPTITLSSSMLTQSTVSTPAEKLTPQQARDRAIAMLKFQS
jgi:hypothetical protein